MQESLAPPTDTKLAKRLWTLWDVTVPYSAKKQLHEDYARTPSDLPLFLVPQLPKELSLKLTKSKRKEDKKTNALPEVTGNSHMPWTHPQAPRGR